MLLPLQKRKYWICFKTATYAHVFPNVAKHPCRGIIVDEDVHERLLRSGCSKGHSARIFQATGGYPANALVLKPVLINGIPLVVTRYFSYPMAALIVIIGHFLDEAHELRKIV